MTFCTAFYADLEAVLGWVSQDARGSWGEEALAPMTYHNEIDPALLCSIHDLLVLASGTVIDCYSRGATS